MADTYITRQQAAEHIGMSIDTIDRMREEGLPWYRPAGRTIKFKVAELDAYMERQRQCLPMASSKSQARRAGTSSGQKADVRTALQRARQIASKQRPYAQRSA